MHHFNRSFALGLLFAASLGANVAVAQESAETVQFPDSGFSFVVPEEKRSQNQRDKESLMNNGYIERVNDIPQVDFVLGRIAQRKRAVKSRGAENSAANLGFHDLDTFDIPGLKIAAAHIPTDIIHGNSQNYVFPNSSRFRRVYSHTKFGALMIDEMTNAEILMPETEFVIGGLPANLVITKNRGGKWTTTAIIDGDGTLIMVEVNTRIQGPRQAEFIAFLSALIQSRGWN